MRIPRRLLCPVGNTFLSFFIGDSSRRWEAFFLFSFFFFLDVHILLSSGGPPMCSIFYSWHRKWVCCVRSLSVCFPTSGLPQALLPLVVLFSSDFFPCGFSKESSRSLNGRGAASPPFPTLLCGPWSPSVFSDEFSVSVSTHFSPRCPYVPMRLFFPNMSMWFCLSFKW